MYNSTSKFIELGLPTILSEMKGPLQCIFTSSGEVSGYASGSVDTGKNSLAVEVQNGHGITNLHDLMLYSIAATSNMLPRDIADKKLQELTNDANKVQCKVGLKIDSLDISRNTNVFAYIYADLLPFKETLEWAAYFKEEYVSATVIVLTCDCDITSKTHLLERYVQGNKITDYVITDACGGCNDMRQVLDAVMEQWPKNQVE